MKHMLQHKTQSEHPFCIRDEATQISIASLSATHSDGPMKASGYAVRMARRSRDGVRPAGRIHDGPRMTRWPADDESTTARWICDRARPASGSTSGSRRRRTGHGRRGADPRQGAAGAVRMGHGNEQAARHRHLGRRGEELAAFGSTAGEATVWVRELFLSRDSNM